MIELMRIVLKRRFSVKRDTVGTAFPLATGKISVPGAALHKNPTTNGNR